MHNQQIREIFHRYLENSCSPDEVRKLIAYFSSDDENELRRLINEALEQPDETVPDERLYLMSLDVLKKLRSSLEEKPARVLQMTFKRWVLSGAAACLLLLLGSAVYLSTKQKAIPAESPRLAVTKPIQDTLAPAGNKAILILSSGDKINLDNAQAGLLAADSSALIRKSSDGKLVYEAVNAPHLADIEYNTLITPRGGRYDLTLSDGTKVSLNAASSIRYPSAFTGNTRQVEITGEAYLEVKHDNKKPFRVLVAGQVIEDLGTRFNINAYPDENSVATTLIEGSIRMSNKSHSVLLRPGQEAFLQSNNSLLIIRDADLDEVMAWHRGLFTFHDADIQTVMRQLSRWYDVDISYEGAIPQRRFSGKIYRNISAQKVADILQYKQIHFRIEGRKIIVMP